MTLKQGDRVPSGTFKQLTAAGIVDVHRSNPERAA